MKQEDDNQSGTQEAELRGVPSSDLLAGYLTCEDCGVKSSEVRRDDCPYASDIDGEHIQVNLCPSWYYERCMDI